MTALSTKWHTRIDYLLAFTLICSPWLFYFRDNSVQTVVPVICGVLIIVYSLLTRYEISIIKLISPGLHFALDTITGIFLAISPWIFGFSETVYLPHLILGLIMTVLALITGRNGAPHTRTASARHSHTYSHYHFSAWLGHKE